MAVGRFLGGIGALIRSQADGRYLLLKRSQEKDYARGVWESVTGRVDQGEGFEDALRREVREELGIEVEIEFIIGTTHFYRGAVIPENELVGVVYGCAVERAEPIRLSAEHSDYRWVTADEARALLTSADPPTEWMRRVIERAEAMRPLMPPTLLDYLRGTEFELG